MSRKKRNHQVGMSAKSAWGRARQTAAQVKPVARSAGAAASRRVHRTRAWAAPQVKRTGQVLQDRVAPKASALLSSAARRIEPAKPARSRWRKLAGISMLTAAASAVAALARKRRKPDVTPPAAEAEAEDMTPTPQAQTQDGQATAPTDAKAK